MHKLLLAFVSLAALGGCGKGDAIAGTYRNASGAEIILNPDGTYRYMIGERTSPQDILGTYRVSGNQISFGGEKNRFKGGTISPRHLAVSDGAGGTSDFSRG